jgi:hypothetical protein
MREIHEIHERLRGLAAASSPPRAEPAQAPPRPPLVRVATSQLQAPPVTPPPTTAP